MTDVSQEYAVALFSLAREDHADYSAALSRVAEIFRGQPAYTELLASPGIPVRERTEAIRQALEGTVPERVLAFVQLLCRNGEIRRLDACVNAYVGLEDAARRHATAEVVSAVPLDEGQREALQARLEKLSGRRVTLECTVDPSLIGGAVVRMDGCVLDGSVKRRLRDIKEVIDT